MSTPTDNSPPRPTCCAWGHVDENGVCQRCGAVHGASQPVTTAEVDAEVAAGLHGGLVSHDPTTCPDCRAGHDAVQRGKDQLQELFDILDSPPPTPTPTPAEAEYEAARAEIARLHRERVEQGAFSTAVDAASPEKRAATKRAMEAAQKRLIRARMLRNQERGRLRRERTMEAALTPESEADQADVDVLLSDGEAIAKRCERMIDDARRELGLPPRLNLTQTLQGRASTRDKAALKDGLPSCPVCYGRDVLSALDYEGFCWACGYRSALLGVGPDGERWEPTATERAVYDARTRDLRIERARQMERPAPILPSPPQTSVPDAFDRAWAANEAAVAKLIAARNADADTRAKAEEEYRVARSALDVEVANERAASKSGDTQAPTQPEPVASTWVGPPSVTPTTTATSTAEAIAARTGQDAGPGLRALFDDAFCTRPLREMLDGPVYGPGRDGIKGLPPYLAAFFAFHSNKPRTDPGPKPPCADPDCTRDREALAEVRKIVEDWERDEANNNDWGCMDAIRDVVKP